MYNKHTPKKKIMGRPSVAPPAHGDNAHMQNFTVRRRRRTAGTRRAEHRNRRRRTSQPFASRFCARQAWQSQPAQQHVRLPLLSASQRRRTSVLRRAQALRPLVACANTSACNDARAPRVKSILCAAGMVGWTKCELVYNQPNTYVECTRTCQLLYFTLLYNFN